MITDVLIASPIINEGMEGGDAAMAGVGAGAGAGGAGASQFADFGGIDPNLDPELAMALRISLEEERNRQRPAEASQPVQADAPAQVQQPGAPVQDVNMGAEHEEEGMEDEEAILQRALQMSINDAQKTAGQATPGATEGGSAQTA